MKIGEIAIHNSITYVVTNALNLSGEIKWVIKVFEGQTSPSKSSITQLLLCNSCGDNNFFIWHDGVNFFL